jgi:hypothetical protein
MRPVPVVPAKGAVLRGAAPRGDAPMGGVVVDWWRGDWPTEVAPRLFSPLPAKGAVVVVVVALVLKLDMVSVLLLLL